MSLVLTVTEVAKMLDIPRGKVYILIEDGYIDAFRIGYDWRIKQASLEKFLKR